MLLVEALTTIALSALVLSGLVATSGLFLRVLDRSVAHVHDVEALDRTMTAIGSDLRRLARARWDGPGAQPFIFDGTPTRLVFARTGSNLPGLEAGGDRAFPGERVVSISSQNIPQGGRILRREAPLRPGMSGPGSLVFGESLELQSGRARLRFAYLAPSPQGRAPQPPQATWPSGPLLPEAVLMEMVDPETGRVVLSARTRLMVDSDIGCLQGGVGPCGLPDRQEEPATAAPSPRVSRAGDRF